jgi:hypothetical protein
MRVEVMGESDVAAVGQDWQVLPEEEAGGKAAKVPTPPTILTVADLRALQVDASEMLFDGMPIPTRGASLVVGAAKSGKTLLAVQQAAAVASGAALFDTYRVLKPGAALIVEQDDPGGEASIKGIIEASKVKDVPLYTATRLEFGLGPKMIEWLEKQAVKLSLRLIVLDSYTALRGPRTAGIDICKAEQGDLMLLDALAKRIDCAIVIIHHASKGSAAMDWTEKAAGTYVMSAATEAQVHVSRFGELAGPAPERLIRVRGRHAADLELVLRFRKETLDYEHVLEGEAAPFYPLILQLQTEFGSETFGAKDLSHRTGVSRATAHRQIDRLYRSNVLVKHGYGVYGLAVLKL